MELERPISAERAKCLLLLWTLRAHKSARAHYMQAVVFRAFDRFLTLLNAGLSIFILFFATLDRDVSHHRAEDWIRSDGVGGFLQLLGMIGPIGWAALALVVTTIFQFILRWGERNLQHKFAATEFSNLQRKAERYYLLSTLEMGALHNLNREYNHITKSYDMVHPSVWKAVGPGLDESIERYEAELRGGPSPGGDRGQTRRIPLWWRLVFWIVGVS